MISASFVQQPVKSAPKNAASMLLTTPVARLAKKPAVDAPRPVWPAANPLPAAKLGESETARFDSCLL
jgi:hypothetical protein